jgi:hypothetical protein
MKFYYTQQNKESKKLRENPKYYNSYDGCKENLIEGEEIVKIELKMTPVIIAVVTDKDEMTKF